MRSNFMLIKNTILNHTRSLDDWPMSIEVTSFLENSGKKVLLNNDFFGTFKLGEGVNH